MEKRTYLIFIISIFALLSCNEADIDEEQNAYLDIIPFLIEIDEYYQPAPPPTLILNDSSQKNFETQKEVYASLLNDYRQLKDTIAKFLIISDTLKSLDTEVIMNNVLHQEEYRYLSQNEENTGTRIAIENLQGNYDVKLLADTFFIESKSNFYNLFGFKGDKFYIGYLVLSRILFNKDYTKGVLVYNFSCGKKCGNNSIVLIKKHGNKWVIKERIILDIF